MDKKSDSSWCFGCGKDNPIGLHLQMHWLGDHYVAVFTPKKEHESYGDRMHGGLTCTLLDEVMGDYVFHTVGIPAYTAHMDIRYRQPVPIGQPLTVEAWLVKHRGRLYIMQGRVTNADGSVAAEAKAEMMLAK